MFATYLGIHELGRPPAATCPGTRTSTCVAAEKRFLADLEAIDPAGLSAANTLEREMAILGARRLIFDEEVHRTWERRVTAGESLGDALFLLFARDFAPLPERLDAIAARLEAAPAALTQVRDRLGDRPRRPVAASWSSRPSASLPGFFDLILDAGRWRLSRRHPLPAPRARRGRAPSRPSRDYAAWIREQLPRAGDEFALGAGAAR